VPGLEMGQNEKSQENPSWALLEKMTGKFMFL